MNDSFDLPDNSFAFPDMEEFSEQADFIDEVDSALRRKLAGTPWEEQATQMMEDTPWDERIAFYQALHDAKALPEAATYFLVSWALESLADERIDELYDTQYESRFTKIKIAHGLAEDDDWEPGEGPAEYEALDQEFTQAAEALMQNTYQHFGEQRILVHLRTDPVKANKQFEQGQKYIDELITADFQAYLKELE